MEERSGDAKKEGTREDDVATENSNGDVNEVSKKCNSKIYKKMFQPRESQVKSASTSKGSQVRLTGSIQALLLLLLGLSL